MKFGFIGPTYQSASLNADAQRSMNLFPEAVESGTGKNAFILRGTPGLSTFCTLPTSPVRGLWSGEDRLFAATSTHVYEVFSDGTYTDRGTIATGSTPVQMFPNGTQLFIVGSGRAYIDDGLTIAQPTFPALSGVVDTLATAVTWVSGDTFSASMIGSTITIDAVVYTISGYTDTTHITVSSTAGTQSNKAFSSTPVLMANTGAFLDGYFIAAQPNSKTFYISAINDGTSWDPLDFAVKEGYPDNINAVFVDHEEIWLFGTQTTEVWRNTGAATFPFERDPGAFIHQGCIAAYSVVRLKDGPAWLGGDPRGWCIAYRAQGYREVRVSTHAVEYAWSLYSTVADAQAFSYQDEGHDFWVINFPTAGTTWVYDATTNLWHERGYWDGAAIGRHRAACHAYQFQKHLVGDYSNGKIYQMSSGFYDDAGTSIHRIRTAPHVSDSDSYSFFSRFRLELENSGEVAPSLDWSVDGGHTFNTPRTTSSNVAGSLAMYDFRRLGRSRDRVFRITITAAVKVAMIDASVEVTKGFGAA